MASHWVIIIAASDQTEANSMTGQNSFTVGLSATGDSPATHYWIGISDPYKNQVYSELSTLDSFDMVEQTWDNPPYVSNSEILSSRNLKTMLSAPPPWWPPQE